MTNNRYKNSHQMSYTKPVHQITNNRYENSHQVNLTKPTHQMTKIVADIVIR